MQGLLEAQGSEKIWGYPQGIFDKCPYFLGGSKRAWHCCVRAGIVEKPGDWKWSGYQFYAHGELNDLLELHPTYLGLSSNPESRKKACRDYVNMSLPGDSDRKSGFSNVRFIGSTRFGENLGLSTGDF